MMNALAGGTVKVIGSSSATVIAGPMPGSTPTRVPSVTPTSAYSRLTGVIAAANPSSSSPSDSTQITPASGPAGSLTPSPWTNSRYVLTATTTASTAAQTICRSPSATDSPHHSRPAATTQLR